MSYHTRRWGLFHSLLCRWPAWRSPRWTRRGRNPSGRPAVEQCEARLTPAQMDIGVGLAITASGTLAPNPIDENSGVHLEGMVASILTGAADPGFEAPRLGTGPGAYAYIPS